MGIGVPGHLFHCVVILKRGWVVVCEVGEIGVAECCTGKEGFDEEEDRREVEPLGGRIGWRKKRAALKVLMGQLTG